MDAEGKLLPSDGESQGELVLRAPWLTQGYLNRDPARTALATPSGTASITDSGTVQLS